MNLPQFSFFSNPALSAHGCIDLGDVLQSVRRHFTWSTESLLCADRRSLRTSLVVMQTFFMHIGKTAGSAINQMLQTHFGERFIDHIEIKPQWQENIEVYDCLSGHFNYGQFKKVVNERPFRYMTVMREPISQFRSHLNWLRVLGANPNLRKNTGEHILVLSDELINMDLSDPDEVRNFLNKEENNTLRMRLLDNSQSRYFLYENIDRRFNYSDFKKSIDILLDFDFVGVSEDSDGIVSGIKSVLELDVDLKLPRANVQGYDREFDRAAWRKVIGDWIAYDCSLYELARNRAGY